MPNLVQRRLLPLSLGILAVVAAGVWIAASKPAAVAADHSASTATAADASCNPASCEAARCDEAPSSAPAQVASAPQAPAPAPAPKATAGLVAHLDPETGVIGGMPPAGLESELVIEREDVARPIDAIASDGSPMQLTNGAFDEFTVVRLDAQGRRITTCGPNAKALLTAPPALRYEER